ncbi:glycoside hydrolase family 88 protein [candidate division KSB1 bacterium]|nr:glycoside hydrolase family 88 protein [candidate division KSB1 bacterium]RQW09244.1 MAG: T9SS C-terminal target domain-containing protein [candidate division KSB1 bacterium]
MKNQVAYVFVSLFLSAGICSSQALDSLIAASLPFALERLAQSTSEITSFSQYPEKTDANGRWQTFSRGSWTSGFFPGALWYAYALTQESSWRDLAISWSTPLEPQKNSSGSHDVGFQMMSSWGNWYKLTGRVQNVDVLITTANSLAERFDETIGCTRSWGSVSETQNFLVIVDNMMNLELLFWAAGHGGDSRLYDMAVKHADRTREEHVRENGSTFHVVDFNLDGTVKRKYTHQGYQDWSTWSRGQAWGIYGFTMCYRESRQVRFLDTACKMADYFLTNLPADHVPYCDFDSPNIPDESRDASAAAITCSALFELDTFVAGDEYRRAAEKILTSLLTSYLSRGANMSSILQKGCVRYGSHEQGLIYADYYLLEAISRTLGIELKPIDPVEPEERLFSDIPFFGDANNFSPCNASRWSVGPDENDLRYYINTSDFTQQDGERVGEYALVRDSLYQDFDLSFRARTPEDFSANEWVDLVVIFGFQDDENYNYAMLNSNPAATGNAAFSVRDGVRQPRGHVTLPGLVDNDYHDYLFRRTGATIEFFIDGRPFYTFSDGAFATSGQIGVGSYNDAAFFDDIMVTRPIDSDVAKQRLPAEFVLRQYPNPFNGQTTIRFHLAAALPIRLSIYDATGQRVVTLYEGNHTAGDARVIWRGNNDKGESVSSGVYFVTLESPGKRESRKMVLIK